MVAPAPPVASVATAVALFQPPPDVPALPQRPKTERSRADSADADDDDATATESDESGDNEDDEDGAPKKRRRRRGGRRRRKPGTGDGNESDESESDDQESGEASDEDDEDDDNSDGQGSTRRRRRRRRTTGSGDGADEDDPPNTVVHVRQGRNGGGRNNNDRNGNDQVTSVKGSTRLEAKKQRRREGREAGRRRAPILTEAEFLARRESVDRVMVVRQQAERTQIAVLEDGVLAEHYVNRSASTSMVGNVYLGRVQNVLPQWKPPSSTSVGVATLFCTPVKSTGTRPP